MRYNIIYGDKLWDYVVFPDYFSDCIRVYNSEVVPVGTSNGATHGLFESIMLGIADSSKLGKSLDSREGALLGVSDWDVEGIPEGTMLGTNEGCEEYKSLGISE